MGMRPDHGTDMWSAVVDENLGMRRRIYDGTIDEMYDGMDASYVIDINAGPTIS